MNRISLFAGSSALSLTLLLAAACSANHNVAGGSPTPNAAAGDMARAGNAGNPVPTPPSDLPPPPPTAQSEEDKLPRVNAQDAKRLVEAKQAVLVDVRSEDAYKSSHAAGAMHVNLTDIEAGKHNALPRDKEIITYCT